MAAPEYVPGRPNDGVRTYESPPRRGGSWRADRPGDLGGEGQPTGDRFGSQGPDQGYALGLARRLLPELHLTEGESPADVTAALVAVALKRASLFGRAPVIHDLRVAATLYGYLDASPPAALVAQRRVLVAGVAHPHHYAELGSLADAVDDEVLRLTPARLRELQPTEWKMWLAAAETVAMHH